MLCVDVPTNKYEIWLTRGSVPSPSVCVVGVFISIVRAVTASSLFAYADGVSIPVCGCLRRFYSSLYEPFVLMFLYVCSVLICTSVFLYCLFVFRSVCAVCFYISVRTCGQCFYPNQHALFCV